jgi:hypothetical protein
MEDALADVWTGFAMLEKAKDHLSRARSSEV